MHVYTRILNLQDLLAKKSHFLLGPRQTGKSHLIRTQLGDRATIIDLLDSRIYLRLQAEPWLLESLIEKNKDWIVIDEVQKIPILLNEVHRLIENKQYKFLLTGSSARSLKKKNVNLLAGRAWQSNLFPLCYAEIEDFDLNRYLTYGGLPGVYQSENPTDELKAYVNTYLKEEIQAESAIRRIPAFTKFLQSAAISSGSKINFTKMGNDAQCSPNTVKEYYHILEDTLLGWMLPPYESLGSRKTSTTAKFYYFDIGIKNNLQELDSLSDKTSEYGSAFEHFIAQELRAYLSYAKKDKALTYWQNNKGLEVDFVIGNDIAIEVKATTKADMKDTKGLKVFSKAGFSGRSIVISRDEMIRTVDDIEFFSWQYFVESLWSGKII